MKNLILFIGTALILFSCKLPQPTYDNFEGQFIYSIDSPQNNPDPTDSINYQVIYAKDSLLRIDNFTPIGKQIFLQKTYSDTAYILMDLGFKKVAIQTVFENTKNDSSYVFEYKSGGEVIAGEKTKNIKVIDKELDTTIIMNYIPSISPKYSTALEGIPGLPAKYSVLSKGQWLHFQLKDIQRRALNPSLFMIPPGYEVMSLDEFMELIQDH